jgi:hypothetical protein
MSLLLLQSASWTKPKAKSRNWPMIRNPRAATPCDSVAKFGREDLEMRLRPPTRFESAFSLILGLVCERPNNGNKVLRLVRLPLSVLPFSNAICRTRK